MFVTISPMKYLKSHPKENVHPNFYLAMFSIIDDGLEEMRWMHALGGKSLPAASYGILSQTWKKNAIRDGYTAVLIVLEDNFAVAQEVIHSCCCTVKCLL